MLGVKFGYTQYHDAFRRAEYYNQKDLFPFNPRQKQLRLKPKVAEAVKFDVPNNWGDTEDLNSDGLDDWPYSVSVEGSGCGTIAYLDASWYFQTVIAPTILQYNDPSQIYYFYTNGIIFVTGPTPDDVTFGFHTPLNGNPALPIYSI